MKRVSENELDKFIETIQEQDQEPPGMQLNRSTTYKNLQSAPLLRESETSSKQGSKSFRRTYTGRSSKFAKAMHSAVLACEREEQAASVDIEFQDEKSKQDICNDSDVREQITEGS